MEVIAVEMMEASMESSVKVSTVVKAGAAVKTTASVKASATVRVTTAVTPGRAARKCHCQNQSRRHEFHDSLRLQDRLDV
jgi:hypothetical protein